MFPRESGQYIEKLSKDVKICNEKVSDLSKQVFEELVAGNISINSFAEHPCHPSPNNAAVNWIFLVDTLNYCFWSSDNRHWEVNWKGVTYTGYFGLCAAVNKAMEQGLDITNPEVYRKLELKDLEELLRGDNGVQLSLLQERLDGLHQAGTTLVNKYKGDFANCIHESDQSAKKLLQLVVSEFPSYRDEADYCGERVSFYKRAQILIGDIWACFEGEGLGTFRDIDTITMFADYRVPQVLVHFGVLQYSKELNEKLKRGEILDNGSRQEVEIRGCSIEAVERVKMRVDELIRESDKTLLCNSVLIDHFLWTYRRKHRDELDKIPFHKTICIFY